MASILRSGKFVRYFAGLTRNIIFNTVRETEGSFIQKTPCICSTLTHGYATAAPKADQNLEKSLKRLDQDVRRTGRISRRDIEDVLEEIRQQRSATSSQSLLVIRCCGNLVPEELPEIRTTLVQEIWKTLNSLNVPMDISHYNALLRVYLENEHQFSPTDFLSDLESKGIEPNRVTYQRLISRYCQEGDIEGATRILEYMREKGLPVNENVFNALILGHSEANDMESAAGILGVMKQAGLEPSADTYTTLLCCYARHGDMDSIIRTLNDCEKNEIYLLDKDLLDVLYSLTCNGYGDKSTVILEKIRKSAGYNQDAVNIILRLTNKGYEDVAFEILKSMPRSTRSDGELSNTGTFFIRQMIKAQRPIEKILIICNEMIEKNLNTKALQIATEASLDNGLLHTAVPLLKEMKNSGLPIRQHYFWPLICSVDSNNIIDILKKMQNDFQINPNSETIREYVIPNLNENNWENVVTMLRTAGISAATASSSAVYSALIKNKIKDAAFICEQYKAYYSPGLFRKPLITALGKTNDHESYIKIVRQIYDNLPRNNSLPSTSTHQDSEESAINENDESDTTNRVAQAEFVGQIILDAVLYFKQNRIEQIERTLNGLVQQGLTISNTYAERIQERIGAEMTTEISELLGKLSSGDLEPSQLNYNRRKSNTSFDSMSVEQLENFIQTLEAKNENTKGLKRYLISASFKTKNLEKTEEIIQKLEKENYVISSGVFAQLIELYCHHGNLIKAMEVYETLKKKEPDFVLDNHKIIRICELLIKDKKHDEVIEFLKKNKRDEQLTKENDRNSFNYTTTCWRILNQVADNGNPIELNRIFDALLENNFITINNVLLGPLIKVHLVNDDLKTAVDTFETICQKYKSTPWKNELACRLIQSEDATNLQKLTDLSTNIHGEVNSLYDLVFSFVECGRIRQARKILETPGLRNRPQRINSACERYRQEGMIQPLEGLIEATKDLNHIDRNDIYYNLLLSYCKEPNQPEKALGLWTKMQEEDITPSDVFLSKLSELLKQNNFEVPFIVPTIQKNVNKSENIKTENFKTENIKNEIKDNKKKTYKKEPQIKTDTNVEKISETLQNLRKAIRSEDPDAVLRAKNDLKSGEKPSILDQSRLIELLLKSDRITEATKCVDELLQQKLYPLARIFKYYLNKLANSGDIITIKRIGDELNNDTKKLISFDNRYCHAMIVAGKAEEYMKQLGDNLDNAKTEEELKVITDKFPRGGALGILETHPELIEKFEEIAEKYAQKGILGPMNVLWVNYFVNGNEEKIRQIWDKYLKTAPRLMFQRILQASREKQDEKLIQNLIKYLKETKISEGAFGNAYSCYIDVLTAKDKYDESLNVLKNAIDDVCLENINKTALARIKTGLEAKGKNFPYKIPEKNSKLDGLSSSSSSSSSSSDDDVSPPTPDSLPTPKVV